jgi:hypothetical protein
VTKATNMTANRKMDELASHAQPGVPLGLVLLCLATVTAGILAGCQKTQQKPDDRVNGLTFQPEDDTRSARRFAAVQISSGARTDATLRTYEFDRGDLNSAGRQKLDSMLLDDDAVTPMVVYLDVPSDADQDAREESVRGHLKDRGLTPGQIKVVLGTNPGNLIPAAPALRGKAVLDSGAPNVVNPEPAGSAGAVSPAGGK